MKMCLNRIFMNWLILGFFNSLALFAIGAVHEILGMGSLFGVALFHEGFQPWLVMLLPSGGFFTLAGWLLLKSWLEERRESSPAPSPASGPGAEATP